jgi:hypothetical protein
MYKIYSGLKAKKDKVYVDGSLSKLFIETASAKKDEFTAGAHEILISTVQEVFDTLTVQLANNDRNKNKKK